MGRAIVNIRGANGSGKSTVPMAMLEDPKKETIYLGVGKTGKPIKPAFTIFPTYGWIALGTYKSKTGGLDTMAKNEDSYTTLMHVLKNYPEYDVVFEGIIASSVYQSWATWLRNIEELFPQDTVIIMNFMPPYETCIERIYGRNGGKPFGEKTVLSKCRVVARNAPKFKRDGFLSLKVDTSKYSKEQMLPMFMKVVEKYRKGERTYANHS